MRELSGMEMSSQTEAGQREPSQVVTSRLREPTGRAASARPAGTAAACEPIDVWFSAAIQREGAPGGWTIAVVPGSGEIFGTRRPVKVAGTMDGHPFEATLLPMGDGTHMVPIRAALRTAVGKDDGDPVVVHLSERRSR